MGSQPESQRAFLMDQEVAAEAARAAAAAAAQAAIAFWQVFAGSSEELRQARASKNLKHPSVADERES